MPSLSISDVGIMLATLAGPIFAVQAQKIIETWREKRSSRLRIFHVLMATRATRLAPSHVEALNSIELAFGGDRSTKAVIATYRIYFDRLSEQLGEDPAPASVDRWLERCGDLFVELLFEMSKALGFAFDKVQLRRGVYHPRLHYETELAERHLRNLAIGVFSGQQPLSMRVTELPSSPQAVKDQQELSQKVAAAFRKDGSLSVTVANAGPEGTH